MITKTKRKVLITLLSAAVAVLLLAGLMLTGTLSVNKTSAAEQPEWSIYDGYVPSSSCRWKAGTADTYGINYVEDGGYTRVSGLNNWGRRVEYDKKVKLDGLTVSFWTNEMDTGARFGFGLVANSGNYSPEDKYLDMYFAGTPFGQTRLAFAKNHNYTNDNTSEENNIGYWWWGGQKQPGIGVNGEKSIVFDYAETNKNYGIQLKFTKVNQNEWTVDWSVLAGGFVKPWGQDGKQAEQQTKVYIDAEYIPVDSNGELYLCAWGINADLTYMYKVVGDETGTLSTSIGENGYTKINGLRSYGDRAYYNQKVKLDGLTLSMYSDALSSSYPGAVFGFGLAKAKNDMPTEYASSYPTLNGVFKVFSTVQGRFNFGRSHDITYPIAYADKNLRDFIGFADGSAISQYIWDFPGTTSKLGVKITFNYLPNGDVWQLTVEPINSTMRAGQKTTSYVSNAYIETAMDKDGYCYLVGYGFLGDEERAASSTACMNLNVKVEQAKVLTYNINEKTFTDNVVVGGTTVLSQGEGTASSFTEHDNGGKLLIGWESNGTLYKKGQQITVNSDMQLNAVYIDYVMNDGASVLKNENLENAGIRFIGEIKDDQTYQTYKDKIKGIGVIIMPKDLITADKEFTFEEYGEQTQNFFLPKSNFKFEDSVLSLKASIVDLYSQNYNRRFAARGYVTVEIGGADVRIYTDYTRTNNSRTIYQVAASAINAGEQSSTLTKYVDSVLNVSYTNGTFSLVNPIATSTTVESLGTCTYNKGTITLKVNVKDGFAEEYGKFAGLIFNNARVNIANSQTLSGYVMTIVFEEPKGEVDNIFTNFWTGDTMYEENVMLVAKAGVDGTVYEAPKAKLMFNPTEILSVKWYYHYSRGNVTVEFTEGTDFDIIDGYIVAKGSKKVVNYTEIGGYESSYTTWGNMPYVTDRQVTGIDLFPGLNPVSNSHDPTQIMKSCEGIQGSLNIRGEADGSLFDVNYKIPFSEQYHFFQMQLYVTYRHSEGGWTNYTPAYYGDTALSRVVAKLNDKNTDTVNMLFNGDSICAGCFSSKVKGLDPMFKHWAGTASGESAVGQGLSDYFHKTVKVTDMAIGGWISDQGLNGDADHAPLDTRFASGDLKGKVFDVAVIAFGMNDATWCVTQETYENNIRQIIAVIRKYCPECDIVVLSPMYANRQAAWFYNNQPKYFTNLQKIASDTDHVCAISISALEDEVLNSGKKFIEMMGNNINHTSDFMNRVYATSILSAFIK